MSKKKKINKNKEKTVRSINNNIRSSVRKLNPILKGIVGKKVDIAIRDLQFSEKELQEILEKLLVRQLQMQKIIFNMILINLLLKKHTVEKKLP